MISSCHVDKDACLTAVTSSCHADESACSTAVTSSCHEDSLCKSRMKSQIRTSASQQAFHQACGKIQNEVVMWGVVGSLLGGLWLGLLQSLCLTGWLTPSIPVPQLHVACKSGSFGVATTSSGASHTCIFIEDCFWCWVHMVLTSFQV